MMDGEIKIEAFTVERTTIKTDEGEYQAAMASAEIGDVYDTYLSDMDGTTVIIDPESGSALDPYEDRLVDLLELLRPILAHVSTWKVEQYAMSRRADEE